VTRCHVRRRFICRWPTGSCRCAARQRQRESDDSQHRYGFFHALRRILPMRHSRFLPRLSAALTALLCTF
jgi:hypothetical protein